MKTLIILLLSFISYAAFAQKSDSTHTHYRLIRGGFVEHSTTLKSDIKAKNGVARIQAGKKVVATGVYVNNERVGRWRFFNMVDSVDQIYNYSTKKVEYSAPDSLVSFEIDSLKPGDRVIPPTKIGGKFYGLHFLFKAFTPSQEFRRYPGTHKIFFIFHLDCSGKLIKYETEIVSAVYKKTDTINLEKFREEDLIFTPAYVNKLPVASRFIYESKLTVN